MTTPQNLVWTPNGVPLVGDLWAGDPSRPVLVMAHGGGQTRHSWGRAAERLAAAGYTVLNYDARGHGDSGWDPHGDYSDGAFAADLHGLIDTLGRPPVVVGASLGGIAALLVAGEHPSSVAGIVLVDVVIDVEPRGVSRILEFMRANALRGFGSLEEVTASVAAYNPRRPRPADLDGIRKNVRQKDDGRWYWHWDPAFLRDGEARSARVVDRLRAAARGIAVPTLIVRGGRSDVVSSEGLAATLEVIPGAQTTEVAAAGHMVAGDDNDAFAASLQAWLSAGMFLRPTPDNRLRRDTASGERHAQ